MSTVLEIGFTLLFLNNLVGIVANGFIVLIICIEWRRSKKLSPTDLTLACLGLSRFIQQATGILYVTVVSFFRCIYLMNTFQLISGIIWLFVNTMNLCIAACLSVLYLVKIAIFSHPLFLYVKQGFSGILPWLLLGSVVFSAFPTINFSCWGDSLSVGNSSQSLLNGSQDSKIQRHQFCEYFAILTIASHFIPALIFLSSIILLITSLWKHIRRVRRNGTGVRDLNTEAHLTAIKALSSFAVLYLSSFVSSTTYSAVALESPERNWRSILLENVIAAYPTGHAIILILFNPKLKQAWLRMIHHFKCPLREAPS